MKNRPLLLGVLSFSFLILALTPLLRLFQTHGTEIFYSRVFFESLTPHDGILIVGGVLSASLTLHASRLLVGLIPLLCLLAALEVFISVPPTHLIADAEIGLWSASSFLIFQILWMLPGPRKALFQPHLRWWKTSRRLRLDTAANVRTGFGQTYVSRLSNLSREGMLLVTKADFQAGDRLDVRFVLGPFNVIHCRAEVVRKDVRPEQSAYGLRIFQIKPSSRVQMKRYFEKFTRSNEIAA
jgi:hypothetical protein